jgi:hypothetical protein
MVSASPIGRIKLDHPAIFLVERRRKFVGADRSGAVLFHPRHLRRRSLHPVQLEELTGVDEA